jgi:hypothetical protein
VSERNSYVSSGLLDPRILLWFYSGLSVSFPGSLEFVGARGLCVSSQGYLFDFGGNVDYCSYK